MTAAQIYKAPDPATTYPWTCHALQNPVTRFDVRVEPPLEITSEAEWASVRSKFSAYCDVAWKSPVFLSPAVIHPSWLAYRPEQAAVADTFSDGF